MFNVYKIDDSLDLVVSQGKTENDVQLDFCSTDNENHFHAQYDMKLWHLRGLLRVMGSDLGE